MHKNPGEALKVGDWCLPDSYLLNGLIAQPGKVVKASPAYLTLEHKDDRTGSWQRQYRRSSILYKADTEREAVRAWQLNERLLRTISDARADALKAIEAIDGEVPV